MTVLKKARFIEEFPPKKLNEATPRQLNELAAQFPQHLFSSDKAEIIAWNQDLAAELQADQKQIEALLLGTSPAKDSFAYNYSGHQFGNWAGQLGDGRALVIGELEDTQGCRQELQLKGGGLTPFSRRGDGFAVLRSSVREYLASEAMHQLGIPTTRALSLGLTGDPVLRDRFYDGNAAYETGAIICRTAPSLLRFGNFEHLAAQNDAEGLEKLLRYSIKTFFPHLEQEGQSTNGLVVAFVGEVLEKTAKLMAQWQSIGFTHGVMNTDNMSILGLTIDYGPYGFMEHFDISYTPNTTDLPGRRYSYGRQPQVAAWNLHRLASALLPLSDEESLLAVLKTYETEYNRAWSKILGEKFGLKPDHQQFSNLVESFFKLLADHRVDMNYAFRELSQAMRDQDPHHFLAALESYGSPSLDADAKNWLSSYRDALGEDSELGSRMCRSNPRFVLKNHVLHRVVEDLDKKDYSSLQEVEKIIRQPYDDWPDHGELYQPAPAWAQSRDIQMNSCSS